MARVAANLPFVAGPDGQLGVWASGDATAKRRPTIVFFYDGAWVKGRRDAYGFVGKAYEAMGNASDPRQTQPISFARKVAPPLWLATGTAETDVEPISSTPLLRRYPGLDHYDRIMVISRPFSSKAPALDWSLAFIHHYGDAPPSPRKAVSQ